MLKNKLLSAMGGSEPSDPYFSNVSLLLHGDGTNGTQNNTFVDSSPNNFSITRNGNTTQGSFSPYGPNWSNYFDGSGDYLRLPSAIDLSGDFTAEAFVYSDSTFTGQNQIFGSDLSTADGNKQLYIAPSTYKLTIYDGSSAHASSGAVPQNQWSHVAITRQGSTLTFYINGVASGTATVTATMSFRIVGGLVSGSGILQQFKGYISNARIVSGTAVYTSNFTPSITPLIAVSGTSLLTCQSNRFIDNSANNFTLTPNGNVAVTPFSPFANSAAYSASVNGGSGYFDGGSNKPLGLPDSASLVLGGDFTVEFWAYNTATTGYYAGGTLIGSDYSSGVNHQFGIYFDSNKITVYDGVSHKNSTTVPYSLMSGWHHYAFTRSGSTLRFFVDGVMYGTETSSVSLNFRNGAIGALGGYGGGIKGFLSSSRILNGTALYTANFTPPTAPVTAVANTSLLLNFTNAGIYDNTGMNNLETVGNAQISTSVKKYGTGAMYFDGSGDWLVAPANTAFTFGTGDFTIEFFVRRTSSSSDGMVIVDRRSSATVGFAVTVGSRVAFVGGASGSGWELAAYGGTVQIDTWHHVAISKSGTTLRVYLDGIQVDSTYTNFNLPDSGNLFIGRSYNGVTTADAYTWYKELNGYIDDLRITKGVARYTANFTPPAQAFPNK